MEQKKEWIKLFFKEIWNDIGSFFTKVFPVLLIIVFIAGMYLWNPLVGLIVTLLIIGLCRWIEKTQDEFKNLMLWRSFNDPFICVEPWTNVLDKDGEPSVEFSKKEGVLKVEVGETKVLERSVEYL